MLRLSNNNQISNKISLCVIRGVEILNQVFRECYLDYVERTKIQTKRALLSAGRAQAEQK